MGGCRINFVYWSSGAGIAQDVSLMEEIMKGAGFTVRHIITRKRTSRVERVEKMLRQAFTVLWPCVGQIHFEQIHREQFIHSRINFLLPNPEFTDKDIFAKFSKPPSILCKTRHAETLFKTVSGKELFVGFTSRDCYRESIRKDYGRYLHVAGLSEFKGTLRLADLWARNPQWPLLTIVRAPKDRLGRRRPELPVANNIKVVGEWMSEESLRVLQNSCGVHICPSAVEGFGHYIMEGLSCGSVVVSTNAPPMNELVSAKEGFLVAAKKDKPCFMSDTWEFKDQAMEKIIHQLQQTPEEQLRRMGASGRLKYKTLDFDFRRRMTILIHLYLKPLCGQYQRSQGRGLPLYAQAKARTKSAVAKNILCG